MTLTVKEIYFVIKTYGLRRTLTTVHVPATDILVGLEIIAMKEDQDQLLYLFSALQLFSSVCFTFSYL
eukprot:maker-scaffold_3-snap-gene-14.49-mRNA-1 protein AED:0.00 eAED:0.00 QI:418/1/1/1/1/1/2/958/67